MNPVKKTHNQMKSHRPFTYILSNQLLRQLRPSSLAACSFCAVLLCTILFGAVSFMSGCSQPTSDEPISKTGFYFNTVITLTVYDTTEEPLLDECFALADKYEKLFSNTIEGSDITNINEAAGEPVTVTDETIDLLNKGIEYGKLSGGSFDITIGELSSLWDFTNNDGTVPKDADIAKAVSTIDYHNVVIDVNQVALTNPDSKLDLGGIAKGYIADRMKDYLISKGVSSALINLGGNVLTIGNKPDGTAYTIALQRPFDDNGEPIATVGISDQTVVTSGVYERYFYVGDKLYDHLLDPSTGYPYDNGLLAVSIICDDSVDGDGLSTTCFSLGLDEGMKLVEDMDGVEAIFITDDYELHTSTGVGTTIPFKEISD